MAENQNETSKKCIQYNSEGAPGASLEDNRETTKVTGLEEQAKLEVEQKPYMQNILTVSDDNLVNNDEIETLELSQQKQGLRRTRKLRQCTN